MKQRIATLLIAAVIIIWSNVAAQKSAPSESPIKPGIEKISGDEKIGNGTIQSIIETTNTYDLRFLAGDNEAITDGAFEVTVQVRSTTGGAGFKMGTGNMVFEYDPAVLTEPLLFARHNFNGQFYREMSLTEPSEGRLSLNLELLAPGYGTEVSKGYMDVATLRFSRVDSLKTIILSWRKTAPNATVLFLDDELTLLSGGKLPDFKYSQQPETIAGNELGKNGLMTGDETLLLPTEFAIHQNYPNPFNPETTIRYDVPETRDGATKISLTVYNSLGQKVRVLVNAVVAPGFHQIVWDGRSDHGTQLASGVYFMRFQSAKLVKTRKMLLVR